MSNLWKKFDEMFGKMDEMLEEMPDFIDEKFERAERKYGTQFTSKSITVTNGKKVVVKNKDGKTTVTINGKEYVEKKK